MKPPLETFTLEYLEEQRTGRANKIATALLERALPDGAEGVDSIVQYSDMLLDSYAPNAANAVRKTLTLPIFLMQRPKRLSFRFGNTELVREAARYDLVEVLTKLHAYLGRNDIRLVKPGVTFAGTREYHWQGTVFEFYLGNIFTVAERGMQPEYLGYVPDVGYKPRSTLNVKIVQIKHK